jgi:hypothetical protein
MIVRSVRVCAVWSIALVLAGGLTACSSSNPNSPSGSVSAPTSMLPADSSSIGYGSQPITLTVQNAVVTKGSGTTYTFEVATDSGFTAKVQTRDGVSEGSGTTSVQLATLSAGSTYYWHARASAGGVTGPFGATFKFTVGAAISFGAPVPVAPLSGQQTSPRPTFTVMNASRQGNTGAVVYKFEVASDSGFGSIVTSGQQPEGNGQTSVIPSSDLPSGTLFWRATATDTSNAASSPPSAVQSFTVTVSQAQQVAGQLGQVLWPGAQPPGDIGHATMGDNWQIQTLHYVPEDAYFQSPTIEMLRIFDLLDRNFDPVGAINWMNANGYPTQAVWYPGPEKAVIGLHYVYLASRNKVVVNGTWEVVLRVE